MLVSMEGVKLTGALRASVLPGGLSGAVHGAVSAYQALATCARDLPRCLLNVVFSILVAEVLWFGRASPQSILGRAFRAVCTLNPDDVLTWSALVNAYAVDESGSYEPADAAAACDN